MSANSSTDKHRKRYPSNRDLRKKLIIVLFRKGFSNVFIYALLGYKDKAATMDAEIHPDGVIARLINDAEYRRQEVDGYLEQYKEDIAKISLVKTKDKEP